MAELLGRLDYQPLTGDAKTSVAVLVDDLVWWFDAGNQPSGIQRVALEVLDAILARPDIDAWPAVIRDGRIVATDRAMLAKPPESIPGRTLARARSVGAAIPLPVAVRSAVKSGYHALGRRVFVQRPMWERPEPDLVIVPGAFWGGDWWWPLSYVAKRLPTRVVMYDLFPLTNPEWVDGPLQSVFRDSTRSILQLADRIVAFGQTPADHLLRVYPLMHKKLRVAVPDLAAHASKGPRSAPAMIADPYLLVVGTVEPRKNIRTILDAWGLARPRLGFGSLVIAGRRGWDNDDLEAEVKGDWYGLSLIRRDHVTDAELDSLYEGAVATIHASWAEGFGLPARESIARGVPALLSSAIPRDGLSDGFRLFDPTDDHALAELMVEALQNPIRLDPAERNGRSGWEPVVSALLD